MKASEFRKFYLTFVVLYGVIDSDESFKIIKRYFPDVKKSQYLKDLKDRSEKFTRGYWVRKVENSRKYIIQDEMLEDDQIDYIFRMVANKGYYTTESLDEYWNIGTRGIDIGDADKPMLELFKKKGLDEAKSLVTLIFLEMNMNRTTNPMEPFQKLIDAFEPKNEKEIDEIFRAYQTLNNNMRLHINGGHTCSELRNDISVDPSNVKIVLGENVTNRLLDGGDPQEFIEIIMNNDKIPEAAKKDLLKQIEDLVIMAKNRGKA